jgi:signal transduction histidine kinase
MPNLNMTPPREPADPRDHTKPPPRRTTVVPPADVGRAGPNAVQDAATLVHELGNLLDGSLRLLSLALRAMDKARGERAGEALEQAHKQVSTASFAMERMADLVHASLRGSALPIGSPAHPHGRPVNVAEAVDHAARVLTPEADEHGITITTKIADDACGLPAGSLYSVVLNGLRNAVDAVRAAQSRRGSPRSGRIEIAVQREPAPPGHRVRWLSLIIRDDGQGPPKGQDAAMVFDYGFSTRAAGRGLGLALSRSLVREMHGTIELLRGDRDDPHRPGAQLRIAIPILAETPHA